MPPKVNPSAYLLPENPWGEIESLAQKAATRKAAIAYCTVDRLGLRKGDVLIVDASDHQIMTGSTSATLLWKLHQKGIKLWSKPGLHAKVICLGDKAVVGSANMSTNADSSHRIELSMVSKSPLVVAGVEAFICRLMRIGIRLDAQQIQRMLALPVTPPRKGNRTRGTTKASKQSTGRRVWLASVHSIADSKVPSELADLKACEQKALAAMPDSKAELGHYHLTGKLRINRVAMRGDTVIEAYRESRSGVPRYVYRFVSVVQIDRRPKFTRIWLAYDPSHESSTITWNAFRKLAKAAGLSFEPKHNSIREIKLDEAERIFSLWPK